MHILKLLFILYCNNLVKFKKKFKNIDQTQGIFLTHAILMHRQSVQIPQRLLYLIPAYPRMNRC